MTRPPRTAGPSVGRRRRAGALGVLWPLLGPSACAPDDRPTLVALGGCGLDEIELSALLLVPRGDFPTAAADGSVVDGGRSGLGGVPTDAAAITVEGKFADATLAVGRTARLEEPDGRLPVYFAPEDELCAVGSAIEFRDVGSMAVGPEGDVLLVGGRDEKGRLVDDIVHARDVEEFITPLDRPLPSPTTGMVVVATAPRRFLAVGGATSDGRVLDQVLPIDLGGADPIGRPTRIDVPGIVGKRSYHAGAPMLDGRVLITGGCTALDLHSYCVPSPGAVLESSFLIDARQAGAPTFERAPSMLVARFGHELLVARDGAVFAVGGRNVTGRGVVTVERWSPGESAWTPYGQTEKLGLGTARAILGAALLEGGLLVVALDDGSIAWVTDAGAGRWTSWCDGDPATPGCFHDESSGEPVVPPRRQLVALPGERVMVDSWLLPFPLLGTTAADAVDLAAPKLGHPTIPPPRRTAAAMATLADGTVLVAGGRDPETLEASDLFLSRLRPQLDGPDERIPQVDEFETGSFVLHDPDRVGFDTDHLTFASEGDELEVPAAWAHVRAFRSTSFRFDVIVGVEGQPGEDAPRPHLVLSQGALAGTSIRFGTGVTGFRRDAAGRTIAFSCGGDSIDFSASLVSLRVDVRPQSIVVRVGADVVANCPGTGDVPSAIGLGVSGEGTMVAYAPLLTRI
jgi:hypothetical protein